MTTLQHRWTLVLLPCSNSFQKQGGSECQHEHPRNRKCSQRSAESEVDSRGSETLAPHDRLLLMCILIMFILQ